MVPIVRQRSLALENHIELESIESTTCAAHLPVAVAAALSAAFIFVRGLQGCLMFVVLAL